MTDWQLDAPVAFFVFNRPEETEQVFEQIAAVEPPRLYVVADGPRDGHSEDRDKCAEVRTFVESNVDWDCELRRNYAEENLGLFERFTTGLKWLFTNESEAIILEDDCVPNRSFFRFCEFALEEYRDDERVMDVTGSNYLGEWKSENQDYHFSFYGGIWGWATWRRSWEWYDPEMESWQDPEIRQRLRDVVADSKQADYLEYVFEKAFREQGTWDHPWGFARLINSAHSIVPARNLVSNVGFGDEATNTRSEDSPWSEIPQSSIEFPIDRKDYVAVDRAYDEQFHKMRPISHRSKTLRLGRKAYERLAGYFD